MESKLIEWRFPSIEFNSARGTESRVELQKSVGPELNPGNEKIDNFIQGVRLKIEFASDIVFEWILYNQFSDIKEIGRPFPLDGNFL